MPWLPILAWVLASQTPATPLDVSTLKLTPSMAIELDLGQLKGELRQIGWSPDGRQLYVQTAEGDPPRERLHHYIVASEGAPLTGVDRQPAWAQEYDYPPAAGFTSRYLTFVGSFRYSTGGRPFRRSAS